MCEELRKTVGVVALLVSFRGDLEREETGGGTGWQSGGNAGNPNFIDGLDEARCKISKITVGRCRLIDPGATQTVDTLGRCGWMRWNVNGRCSWMVWMDEVECKW